MMVNGIKFQVDENDAFECFKYILYDLQLRDQYKPAMAGLHVSIALIYAN